MAKTRNKANDDSRNPETTLSGRTSLYISEIDVCIHISLISIIDRLKISITEQVVKESIKKGRQK